MSYIYDRGVNICMKINIANQDESNQAYKRLNKAESRPISQSFEVKPEVVPSNKTAEHCNFTSQWYVGLPSLSIRFCSPSRLKWIPTYFCIMLEWWTQAIWIPNLKLSSTDCWLEFGISTRVSKSIQFEEIKWRDDSVLTKSTWKSVLTQRSSYLDFLPSLAQRGVHYVPCSKRQALAKWIVFLLSYLRENTSRIRYSAATPQLICGSE